MQGITELKDTNGKIIREGDFVLITQKECDYTFYDLDHENYYLASMNIYDNPYPSIILYVEHINQDQQQIITSMNAKSIDRSYWLRLNNYVPQFKSFPLEANNLNEFYAAYKKYLHEKMEADDLNAMVLLAEYYGKTSSSDYYAFDSAMQKYKKYLESASEKGHAYASYLLSEQYRLILSPPRDKYFSENRSENYKFYVERSAAQGNPTALGILGYNYQYGKDGYKKDLEKAFELYRLSAEQNHPYGLSNLADKYEHGSGVKQDYEQALNLYLKAAAFRVPSAMYDIGNMYLNGKGVEKDVEQAKIWLEKASFYGYKPAKKALLSLYN